MSIHKYVLAGMFTGGLALSMGCMDVIRFGANQHFASKRSERQIAANAQEEAATRAQLSRVEAKLDRLLGGGQGPVGNTYQNSIEFFEPASKWNDYNGDGIPQRSELVISDSMGLNQKLTFYAKLNNPNLQRKYLFVSVLDESGTPVVHHISEIKSNKKFFTAPFYSGKNFLPVGNYTAVIQNDGQQIGSKKFSVHD